MKGLSRIPSNRLLKVAYQALLHDGMVNERKIALWSQFVRFDPRLGEILVNYLRLHWELLNPSILNKELKCQPWPQSAGVLTEFARKLIPKSQKKIFGFWSNIVTSGVSTLPSGQFFIGLRSMAGPLMRDDARFSSTEYSRWGFLSRENLVSKNTVSLHLLQETRFEIIKTLLRSKKYFRVLEYLEALNFSILRRQAQRDLASCPFIKATGVTKAVRYSYA